MPVEHLSRVPYLILAPIDREASDGPLTLWEALSYQKVKEQPIPSECLEVIHVPTPK
jgi:hypothetical protein